MFHPLALILTLLSLSTPPAFQPATIPGTVTLEASPAPDEGFDGREGRAGRAFRESPPAAPAASGQTYYVRPGGDDGACNGLSDTPSASGTPNCAFGTPDACDAALSAGDTCSVAAGTYAVRIRPAASGSASQRLTYVCPGRDCAIRPSSGDAMDLRNRSHVTVDGFRFEDTSIWLWGGSSSNVLVTNVEVIDTDDAPPYPHAETSGGTDNTLRGFTIHTPQDKSNKTTALSVGPNAQSPELRSLFQDGVIRGGWNTLTFVSCTDCTFDGVKFAEAENHITNLCNGGLGCNNLTFRNCVFMAGTGFRESSPQTLGSINGLSLINNAILSGWFLPSPGHEFKLSGTVTVRNNIIFSAGRGSGESHAQPNNSNSVNWDVDYNAYVGSDNLTGGSPFWVDGRNGGSSTFYPDADGNGLIDDAGSSDFDDWQALGFDANSIVFEDSDFRPSSRPYAATLWGNTAPFWGAHVDCVVSAGAFETHSQWGEAIQVGDAIEYEWDGIPRTVTSVSSGSGNGNCDKRIEFSPPLASNPRFGRWFQSWGATPGTRKDFIPQNGSPVIDAGDDSVCARAVLGGGCDIGPVEFDPSTFDPQAPSVPQNLTAIAGSAEIDLQWTPSSDNLGVAGYDILRSPTQGSGHTVVATTPATAWSDTSGTAGQRYYYLVRAYDQAGNRSGASNEATARHPGQEGPDCGNGVADPAEACDGADLRGETCVFLGWSDGPLACTAVCELDTSGCFYTVPVAPAGLTATGLTSTQMSLGWDDLSHDETGFVIERAFGEIPFTPVGTVTAGVSRFTDSSLTPGATYQYRVRATNPAGDSGWSNTASGTTLPPHACGNSVIEPPEECDGADLGGLTCDSLGYEGGLLSCGSGCLLNTTGCVPSPVAPDGLAASPLNSFQIRLTWNDNSSRESGYRIDRRTGDDAFDLVATLPSNANTWVDSGLQAQTDYAYRVRATSGSGPSAWTNVASATTPVAEPDVAPPSRPIAVSATADSSGIRLVWDASTDDVGIAGYDVYRREEATQFFLLIATTTWPDYYDIGIDPGLSYTYFVLAIDGAGNESDPSNKATDAVAGSSGLIEP